MYLAYRNENIQRLNENNLGWRLGCPSSINIQCRLYLWRINVSNSLCENNNGGWPARRNELCRESYRLICGPAVLASMYCEVFYSVGWLWLVWLKYSRCFICMLWKTFFRTRVSP